MTYYIRYQENNKLIESALARPANLVDFGDPDIIDLSASYAFGLAMNHGFIDGNKKTASILIRLFLRLHGMDFTAPPLKRVLTKREMNTSLFETTLCQLPNTE